MTDDEIRAIFPNAEAKIDAAISERDNLVRQAHAEGRTQTDLVRLTGRTRETLRRILNPEAAEAVRRARQSKKTTAPPA